MEKKLSSSQNIFSFQFFEYKSNAEKITQQESLNSVKYYRICFNWLYYFCVAPYRLKVIEIGKTETSQAKAELFDYQPSRYKIIAESWLPQKCLCFFLTSICLFITSGALVSPTSVPIKWGNASGYFAFVYTRLDFIYSILLMKLIWLDKDRILELVNFMIDPENLVPVVRTKPQTGRGFSNDVVAMAAFQALAVMFLAIGLYGLFAITSISSWSLENWWGELRRLSHLHTFLIKTPLDPVTSETEFGGQIGCFLSAVGLFQRRMITSQGDLLMFATALSMRSAVVAFISGLRNESGIKNFRSLLESLRGKFEGKGTWPQVLQQFWSLKQLTEICNRGCSINNVWLFCRIRIHKRSGAHFQSIIPR